MYSKKTLINQQFLHAKCEGEVLMYNEWNDGTVLVHHGIKGQKWGRRNYQYEDGSLTPAGKLRYLGSNSNFINKQKELIGNTKDYIKNRAGDIGRGSMNKDRKATFLDRARTLNNTGAASLSRYQEYKAANERTKAKYSRTKLGKRIHETNAYNAESWSKANRKIANAHGMNVAGAYINSLANTPVKSVITGKTTTSGAAIVGSMLLGPLGTAAASLAYEKNS